MGSMRRTFSAIALLLLVGVHPGRAFGAPSDTHGAPGSEPRIRGARVVAPDHFRIVLSEPLADTTPANFRLTDSRAPDVPIHGGIVDPGPALGGARVDP